MNLYAHQPYWLMKNGIVNTYPSLDKDLSIDVAIMGAGISGALVAHRLRNSGFSCAVFDRRHVGMGSTAASTAFLQYEIDTPLVQLSKYVGEDNAVRSYKLCRKAIYDIHKMCRQLQPQLDMHIRPSLQYASYKKDVSTLHEEFELRVKHGFDIEWLQQKDVSDVFGITAPGAVLSADGGEVDAYMLAHALLQAFTHSGHHVYNNTSIRHIEHNKAGVVLHTDDDRTIKAKKLVIASGYESMKYIPRKIADVHSTYALVSEPLSCHFWHQNSLVWETADPYMYFRVVNGDRILVGGRDDPYHHPQIANSTVKKKAQLLQEAFCKKMSHIPLKADFSWGGAFAKTKDGLPYIGSIPERPHTFFALGFGGNGITFSAIAADIIHDALLQKRNEDAALFTFNR